MPEVGNRTSLPIRPSGREQQLVEEHALFAYAIAREYFIPGADREDVRQEALVGVLKAVRTWQPGGLSLRNLVGLSVRRHLISTFRIAGAAKHRPLTEAIREGPDELGEPCDILELLPAPVSDPYERLLERQRLDAVRACVRGLPAHQRHAVATVANGIPYHHDKTIDNALWRARRKLRQAVEAA